MEPPPAPSFLSDSTLRAVPVAGGRFLQLAYTWSHEGRDHEGVMLLVPELKKGVASGAWSGAWVDSWHQSNEPLALRGTLDASGLLSVGGTFPAPPDPDWGWRITVESPGPDILHLTMYVATPAGEESLAVKGEYTRE